MAKTKKHILCNFVAKHRILSHSLRFGGLLGENPQDKVGLFVRIEGGGDDDVFPGRQLQPRADLPQVDEELWASAGGVGEEKLTLQVDPWPACQLRGGGGGESYLF